jgi:hypothetical protein
MRLRRRPYLSQEANLSSKSALESEPQPRILKTRRTLQSRGRHLFCSIMIDGGFIILDVAPMDRGEEPQRLLTISDTKEGWCDVASLVQALERNQIRDVKKRPLESVRAAPGFLCHLD